MAEPITPQPLMWPGEGQLRDMLQNYWTKYGEKSGWQGRAYEGDFTAGMSDYEQQAMGYLQQYMDAGFSDTFLAGESEIMKTLGGGYDPLSSEYYKDLRAGMETDRENAQARQNRGYQLGGNLSSLARSRASGEMETQYGGRLGGLMLGLEERERQRMLDTVPLAARFGEYRELDPLRKATAGTTIGSLPRQLEQHQLDAQYGDWLRQLEGERWTIQGGQEMLMGYNPQYYWPSYGPEGSPGDDYNKWGGAASGAASGAMMGAPFGPWGMAAGAIGGGLYGYFGGGQ